MIRIRSYRSAISKPPPPQQQQV